MFCSALISSHEVKLQSFESALSCVKSFLRMYKTFHPWFSLHFLLIL